MAKFNGKKGKSRNLAECVLNATFNSSGRGTTSKKKVRKRPAIDTGESLAQLHLGGPSSGIPLHMEPHTPWPNQSEYALQNLANYGSGTLEHNYGSDAEALGVLSQSQAYSDASSANLRAGAPGILDNLVGGSAGYTEYNQPQQVQQTIPQPIHQPIQQPMQGFNGPMQQYDPFAQNSQVLPQQGQLGMGTMGQGYIQGTVPQVTAPQSQYQPTEAFTNPTMGGRTTGIGGETGLSGASLNYNDPSRSYNSSLLSSNVLKNEERVENLNADEYKNLTPGEVAAKQAEFLKQEGLKTMGRDAFGAFGTMIAQSDDTTDNVRPESTGRDILGSAMSGAAAGSALGPWGAVGGAVVGVGTELFNTSQQTKQWEEDQQEATEQRQEMRGQNAVEYSKMMQGTYDSQGGGMGSYYAKYGGPITEFIKKYDAGGPTGKGKESGLYENIKRAADMPKYKRRMNFLNALPFNLQGAKNKNKANQIASRDALQYLKLGDSNWDSNVDEAGNLVTHKVLPGNTSSFFTENIWKDKSGSHIGGKGYNPRQVIRGLKNLPVTSTGEGGYMLEDEGTLNASFDHGGPTPMEKPEGMDDATWANILSSQGLTNFTPPEVVPDRLTNYSPAELNAFTDAAKLEQGEKDLKEGWQATKDSAEYVYDIAKDNPLDAAQVGFGTVAMGADAIPGIGNIVSMGADGLNALTSFGRAGYYGLKGDAANAALYTGLGVLDTAAIAPWGGNVPGATANATRIAKLTKPVLETGAHLIHPTTKAVTGVKAYDLANTTPTASLAYGGNTPGLEYGAGGPFDTSPAFFGGVPERVASNVYDSPLTDAEMREARLGMAAGEQMNRFNNPNTGGAYKEWDPRVSGYIQNELLPDAGFSLSRQNLQTEDGEGTPWSAAIVSGLGQAVDPNFPVSAAHSTYINRAFQNNGDWSAHKTPLLAKNANYNVGDILFQGRGENAGKGFNWFKKQSELNEGEGASYPSHSDMIIGTRTNKRGKVLYDVQGGNVGDTLSTKTYNARQLNRRYEGFLNFNDPSMALGGSTGQAEYETEGGEVMLASPGDAPVALSSGTYKKKASNLYKAEGPKHEQGGIATEGATQPFQDALGQQHDSPYVFSDSEDMLFDATDILKLIS
jgi:hypothetical protein